MSKRTLFARWAAALGLALAALPAVNCFEYSPPIGLHIVAGLAGSPRKAAVALKNHYVVARGTKHNTGFTVRSTRELWPPFRLEGTLGLFDDKHATLGPGGFGISVLNPTLSGFAGATVRRSGDGVEVTGDVGGTSAATPLTLPNDLFVDVAISHDGTDLVVEARALGGGAFQEVGRFGAPIDAYQISLDGDTLPLRTIVGYDRLRVVAAGRRPGLTPIESLREDVFDAADAMADALAQIDGPEPGAAAAAASLATTRDRLAAAIAAAPDAGASTKSRRALAAAQKKVAAAIAAIEEGKKPTTYFNLSYAAAQALVKGADTVK